MKIQTRHFGEVEVDENKLIRFEEGIFGFEDNKKFVVLSEGDENNVFAWLQSADEELLCLPIINPFLWYTDYSPEIDDELIISIGEVEEKDLDVFTVVVVPEDIKNMTTNLKAPILVNHATKKGVQVVVKDEEYGIKHNLYEQIQTVKKAGE